MTSRLFGSTVITLIAVLLGGCRTGHIARAPQPAAVSEIGFFRMAVAAVPAPPGVSLAIDVRPLVASFEVTLPAAARLLPLQRVDSLERRRFLRETRVETGDALAATQCPGWTVVLGDSTQAQRCPKTPMRTVILSLSREGGAMFPRGNAAFMRGVEAGATLRTVRVLIVDSSRFGSSVEAWDYVFSRANLGWQLVARVPIRVSE